MRHVIRFEGGFERNFATLQPGISEYEGEDGGRYPIEAWPAGADGLGFGIMEQRGKRFAAVRVRYGDKEVLLKQPVSVDRDRHLGGRRFSAEPVKIGDTEAGALLGDILDANPEQRAELTVMRDQIRRALHGP
ncbi:MAG TPA: hypothetical protein VMM18_01645 [Gemmatimonadaceae bacterium]|nr:hypothetical protein [Gemmatimonadaceae bacterium]